MLKAVRKHSKAERTNHTGVRERERFTGGAARSLSLSLFLVVLLSGLSREGRREVYTENNNIPLEHWKTHSYHFYYYSSLRRALVFFVEEESEEEEEEKVRREYYEY